MITTHKLYSKYVLEAKKKKKTSLPSLCFTTTRVRLTLSVWPLNEPD